VEDQGAKDRLAFLDAFLQDWIAGRASSERRATDRSIDVRRWREAVAAVAIVKAARDVSIASAGLSLTGASSGKARLDVPPSYMDAAQREHS